jgi:hypothetical protein
MHFITLQAQLPQRAKCDTQGLKLLEVMQVIHILLLQHW